MEFSWNRGHAKEKSMDVVRRIVVSVSLGAHYAHVTVIPDPGTFFSALPTFNCRSIALLPFLLLHKRWFSDAGHSM